MAKISGYELTRKWFDFAFENREAKCVHTAIYMWAIELNNRLKWKEEFGFPSDDAMSRLSIGNRNTYFSALKELALWGFITIVSESKNRHTATVISLNVAVQKRTGSDTATDTGSDTATDTIDKQYSKQYKTIQKEKPKNTNHPLVFFGYPCIEDMPSIADDFHKKHWVIEHSRKAFTAMVDAECSMRIHTKEQKQNEYKMFYDQETLEFINYRPVKCKEPAE